ncbi:SDR family NAD(P)-dependent oxidoreductase [Leucobacter sp. Z1108]|uniref:SDR family NAD(P)-dependent oxidoreductase n=1 Tax=Leucobacter sp. Z1108 TaxID=3439066 RepID=UPI003F2F76DD
MSEVRAEHADRVALVTGAAGGIGAAVSRTLAARGASVIVADFNSDAGEATAAEIRAAGGRAIFRKVDVTDEAQVDAMVQFAVDEFGGLHMAHNNAGILHPGDRFHELSMEQWDRTMEINTRAVALCMRAQIRLMLANGGGSIVNTASGAGIGSAPGISAYTASKHAVVGMTRSAAVEYVRDGIRVNAVAPGTVDTGMLAGVPAERRDELNALMLMGRMAQPQEVAEVVAFLLSEKASYVNGAIVSIDGGSSAHA